jgi:hypothetical protein
LKEGLSYNIDQQDNPNMLKIKIGQELDYKSLGYKDVE